MNREEVYARRHSASATNIARRRRPGLLERVLEVGWAGLTAKESGRIGGLLAHKNRE